MCYSSWHCVWNVLANKGSACLSGVIQQSRILHNLLQVLQAAAVHHAHYKAGFWITCCMHTHTHTTKQDLEHATAYITHTLQSRIFNNLLHTCSLQSRISHNLLHTSFTLQSRISNNLLHTSTLQSRMPTTCCTHARYKAGFPTTCCKHTRYKAGPHTRYCIHHAHYKAQFHTTCWTHHACYKAGFLIQTIVSAMATHYVISDYFHLRSKRCIFWTFLCKNVYFYCQA